MQPQLLFYRKAVPLSSTAHRDITIAENRDFSFASSVNSVPLMAAEFRVAAADSVIVFAGSGDAVVPAVILGVQDKQNNYVNADGSWNGRYIPAFLRRYPFVFSNAPDGKNFTLCIDEEAESINREGDGTRLFTDAGERTEYLEERLKFVQDYQAQDARTKLFCQSLAKHDLLEPMQANFTLANGEPGRLSGFSVISREKLRALPADIAQELLANDALELAFIHLQSTNNLRTLLEKAAATPSG